MRGTTCGRPVIRTVARRTNTTPAAFEIDGLPFKTRSPPLVPRSRSCGANRAFRPPPPLLTAGRHGADRNTCQDRSGRAQWGSIHPGQEAHTPMAPRRRIPFDQQSSVRPPALPRGYAAFLRDLKDASAMPRSGRPVRQSRGARALLAHRQEHRRAAKRVEGWAPRSSTASAGTCRRRSPASPDSLGRTSIACAPLPGLCPFAGSCLAACETIRWRATRANGLAPLVPQRHPG